jgi:hypothetical protein
MHIVLAGDSIFDNDSYVPDGPALIDLLRAAGDSPSAGGPCRIYA